MITNGTGGNAQTSPASRPSLSSQAYVAIRDMLTSVEIHPGEPINEDQLARTLGMGRTPVREAIKRLETERLVVIYPRRGVFATQVHMSDLQLLGEVRVHLEGEAAFQAARQANQEQRAEFERLLAEAPEHSGDLKSEIEFDNRVHRAIYQAAHNPYLQGTLAQYYNLTIRIWHVWTNRLPEMAEHVSALVPLLEAILARDADRARAIAIEHVTSFQRDMDSDSR